MRLSAVFRTHAQILIALYLCLIPFTPAVQAQPADLEQSARFGMSPAETRVMIAAMLARSEQLKSVYAERNRFAAKNDELEAKRSEDATKILNLYELIEVQKRDAEASSAYIEELLLTLYRHLQADALNDLEIAAYVSVIENGIVSFAESEDPEIREAFLKVQEGDLGAIDRLEALVDLEFEAATAKNQAISDAMMELERRRNAEAQQILRKETAVRRRFIASNLHDALIEGEVSYRRVLEAWLRAAELDESDFYQWVNIARLAPAIGESSIGREAVEWTKQLASSDRERVMSLNLQEARSTPDETDGTLSSQQSPVDLALQIYRDDVLENPDDTDRLLSLAGQLRATARSKLADYGFAREVYGKREAQLLDDAERLLEEFATNIEQLAPSFGVEPEVAAEAVLEQIEYNSLRAQIQEYRENWSAAKVYWRTALRTARILHASNPQNINNQKQLMDVLYRLASLGGDIDELEGIFDLYEEAANIAAKMYARDPGVLLYRLNLWRIQWRRGRLARLNWRLGLAEEALTSALIAGRHWSEHFGVNGPIVEVTPLLAQTKLAMGKSDEAIELYCNGWGTAPGSPAFVSAADLDDLARVGECRTPLKLAEIEMVLGRRSRAHEIYLEIAELSAVRGHWGNYFTSKTRIALLELTFSRDEAAVSLLNALDKELSDFANSNAEKPELVRLAFMTKLYVRMILSDIPTGNADWGDVAREATELFNLSDLDLEMHNAVLSIVEIAEALSGADASERPSTALQRHIRTANTALELVSWSEEKDFSRLIPVAGWVNTLIIWPGSGVSNQDAHDLYEALHQNHPDDVGFILAILKGKVATNQLAIDTEK